jgi:hypothetical protein
MYEKTRIVMSRSAREGRRMLRFCAAGGLVAVLVLPLQAQALELGGLTVPTVAVPPPPLPIPTVPTITPPPVPTVTVKAPPPPPVPTLPVKAPTVTTPIVTAPTGTTPTVTVPVPSPSDTSVPVPTVSPPPVKAPAGLPAPAAHGPTRPGGSSTGPAGSHLTSTATGTAAASASGVLAYNATALTLPVFAKGLAARNRTRALTAMIRRYQACLAELPTPSRTLLELRAGLTSGQALGPVRTAARLHLSRAGYARLERQAVNRLRAAGQKGCGTSSALAGAGRYSPWSGTGRLSAVGGVLNARYEKLAPAAGGPASDGASSSLFGLSLSPAARDSLLAAFLAFGGGALVFAFLFLDGLGIGPRHARWRRQFRRRLSLRGPGGRPPGGVSGRRV